MISLEGALRKLAKVLTGKEPDKQHTSMEQMIDFVAENIEAGPAGMDGIGVASITLVQGADGTITSGTWQDSSGKEHEIKLILERKDD